jgi:succinate dehydrogenase/fumarate reductase flavoprotein subunit
MPGVSICPTNPAVSAKDWHVADRHLVRNGDFQHWIVLRDVLEQALAIFRAALPADHQYIAETERRLAALPAAED